MKKILTSVFCLILFLTSCKTTHIEGPAESYLPSELAPAISELPLELELDIKKLEETVNSKMTGLIYEGSNISDRDLTIKVWKAQNFSFFINNNEIVYRVPLKVWSRFAWKMDKFGIVLSDQYEATGTIALIYRTTINIDKNWKLISKTISSGYEWIEKPRLNAIGVSIPFTPIADFALSHFDKMINDQIDKTLSDAVDLKKYVSQMWNEVQKPILISEENNLWLRITPKDILVSPFVTKGNKLILSISFYTQLESILGAQPATGTKVELPQFRNVARQPQQFNLNIAADVTFDKISEMAKKQLVSKSFTEGDKTITIGELSLYSSDGKAVFVADVTGSLKGRIYFTGKLIYNPEKNALEVSEPEFDVKTRSALVKSANWLLHGMILKKIMPYLYYPLTADLESAKTEANKMLCNYQIYDGVTVKGNLDSLTVTKVNMVPGAVRIQGNLKGNVAIKIDGLHF
ncbi:MAG: DUF4403 family protein [Rikenellaceae bacterium]